MKSVTMYTSGACGFCARAKALLVNRYKVENIHERRVDQNDTCRKEMVDRTGKRTVPQIFIEGEYVGGYEDLAMIHESGRLAEMLGT